MKLTVCFLMALLSLQPAFSATLALDGLELSSHVGVIQTKQSSAWIDLHSTLVSLTPEIASRDDLSTMSGYFKDYESIPSSSDLILMRNTPSYFVTVYPEQKADFSVTYLDPYSNPPSTGYPRVTYWREGSAEKTTSILESSGDTQSGSMYATSIPLAPGVYYYYYSARNDHFPYEFTLETSSFVVSPRPPAFADSSPGVSVAVVNARVLFQWTVSGIQENGPMKYRLFLGTAPTGMGMIYEGDIPCFEITSLEYATEYYWQAESINKYGVARLAPVKRFTTARWYSRPFNYPNPFNPALHQTTRIVFNMPGSGEAELTVFTEFGDICWRRCYVNLPRGMNEIIYDGKDDSGELLYNGTYLCSITKKYQGREATERCRLLVVK